MHAGLLPSGSAINRDPPACFHVSWGGTSIGCTGRFIISNLPAHLGSPVQGMSQQHTKNKQQQTMSLSRSVCATRWLRLFTPPISSNWRRAEAKKQTKTKAMLVSAASSSCCCHSFCELDDEAFGYLKRVIVTPAVDSRLA